MADITKRFGLTKLNRAADKLDYDNWSFGVRNREIIDRLLAYAVENHRHTGMPPVTESEGIPLLATKQQGSGLLPSGAEILYRFARVSIDGNEGAASEVLAVQTPNQIAAPGSPRLTVDSGTGTLSPGFYMYSLSIFTEANQYETPTGATSTISLPTQGRVQVLLPSLPAGATGFNVYRRGPLDDRQVFIGTTSGIPPDPFYDDGTRIPVPTRTTPARNSTNEHWFVELAAPFIPASGETIRWYRSYDRTNWNDTYIGVTNVQYFTDPGLQVKPGGPARLSTYPGGAAALDFNNFDDPEGFMPPGMNIVPVEITYSIPGPVFAGHATYYWLCEYDRANIMSIRAQLGRGSTVDAQPLKISTLRRRTSQGSDVWVEIEQAQLQIDPGNSMGFIQPIRPASGSTPQARYELRSPDALRFDITQDGGGSHTDVDLVITTTLLAQYGPTDETHVWGT